MFKQTFTTTVRQARQARTISCTVSRRAEGSTGSSGGGRRSAWLATLAQLMLTSVFYSDSFTKREEAAESMYIRNQEREK